MTANTSNPILSSVANKDGIHAEVKLFVDASGTWCCSVGVEIDEEVVKRTSPRRASDEQET